MLLRMTPIGHGSIWSHKRSSACHCFSDIFLTRIDLILPMSQCIPRLCITVKIRIDLISYISECITPILESITLDIHRCQIMHVVCVATYQMNSMNNAWQDSTTCILVYVAAKVNTTLDNVDRIALIFKTILA